MCGNGLKLLIFDKPISTPESSPKFHLRQRIEKQLRDLNMTSLSRGHRQILRDITNYLPTPGRCIEINRIWYTRINLNVVVSVLVQITPPQRLHRHSRKNCLP
ncbi:hypothetical protein CEXT_213041 [Caerostris extrusa]|uniref:Uncharacterized protein n=1 Tax=Caerostris extrusa TaxID=172846 RepID=A0AAV4QMP8_CAEEX|nr:hypothetical protein CEXT_213041 [Caerostris extrusa]